ECAICKHSLKAQSKVFRLLPTSEPGLPETMTGDAPRLRELLGHLIGNAVKFTHSGSVELYVSVDRPRHELVMRLCDTGIGIPPEKLGMIFESFQQVEGGLSRNYAGLGLGLALARKLTGLMSGKIEVTSVLGGGSTFTVRLPLRHPAEQHRDQGPEPRGAILVVEDNPVGMTVLRHSLTRRSVHVEGVSSGRLALEAATKRRYDVVLM